MSTKSIITIQHCIFKEVSLQKMHLVSALFSHTNLVQGSTGDCSAKKFWHFPFVYGTFEVHMHIDFYLAKLDYTSKSDICYRSVWQLGPFDSSQLPGADEIWKL